MKKNLIIIGLFSASAILVNCNKKFKSSSNPPTNIGVHTYTPVQIPVGTTDNTPADNPITDAGATLGRVLFYDKLLSINNEKACASCHHQENGFSDTKAFSPGFNTGQTARNSMPICNLINAKGFFWDNRTAKLEDMVLQPIKHDVEMGMERIESLPAKLQTTSYYPELFEKAFGSKDVTKDGISKALAQFLRCMTSYNSLADMTDLMNSWGTNTDPRLTAGQVAGAQLFVQSGCIQCHSGSNLKGWGDEGFANIGLELNYADKGMGKTDPLMEGVFKIPSLRNVALTAPYMHDGRFQTLADVVEHYNSGVKNHPNLSPFLRTGWIPGDTTVRRLNLTTSQKQNLVQFLETLTDVSQLADAKFSDPFAK